MFSFTELALYSYDGKNFSYEFKPGLNYIQGSNDTGKTEFYLFLDYMLGKKFEDISLRLWYAGTLRAAKLRFRLNKDEYTLERHLDNIHFSIESKNGKQSFDRLDDYKTSLNDLLSQGETATRNLWDFTEERITFRTFTLFNFLGQKRFGILNDFFDKCSETEYRIKLPVLLDYFFNMSLVRLHEIKKRLKTIDEIILGLEAEQGEISFLESQINKQLSTLKCPISFNGRNKDQVEDEIHRVEHGELRGKKLKEKTQSELEFAYDSLVEQIKTLENRIADYDQVFRENANRESLIEEFSQIIKSNPSGSYLIEPTHEVLINLSSSLSFAEDETLANTLKKMKKERKALQERLTLSKNKFELYTIEDKTRALMLAKEYLSQFDENFDTEQLEELQNERLELKREARLLRDNDDKERINRLSSLITDFYLSAASVSKLVEQDLRLQNFSILYFKRGNILQPHFSENSIPTGYYSGSHARHTLIQLCGYLGFLIFLLSSQEYPLVPVLIIDNIAEPFDDENMKAIGAVFNKLYVDYSKEDIQVILFGKEDQEKLDLQPDNTINLEEATRGKTGFNPFYQAPSDTVRDNIACRTKG
ncbi:hypothetical protein [Raoultibacter phocaeensis]|uniref:hypothetical protein n=1 Tax=Raoultibacter phocaeensis TaxID=2479841 RepID=UPI001119EE1B|nr:hypothetical protein [Raoultibacter phocaeensis]